MDTRLLCTRDSICYNVSKLTGLTPKKLVTIIACETGEPQVFEIYDKFKYARKLKEYIDAYKETYGNW